MSHDKLENYMSVLGVGTVALLLTAFGVYMMLAPGGYNHIKQDIAALQSESRMYENKIEMLERFQHKHF